MIEAQTSDMMIFVDPRKERAVFCLVTDRRSANAKQTAAIVPRMDSAHCLFSVKCFDGGRIFFSRVNFAC